MSGAPLLRARGVEHAFGRTEFRLGPLDLLCERSSHTVILGRNGSGKTTLLRLLGGFLPPRSGRIELDGSLLSAMAPRARARRIAMLADLPPAAGALRVRDAVMMGRYPHQDWRPFDSRRDVQAVEEALRRTDASPLAGRRVCELSSGERQRILLARAIAQEPELLLLDEPSSHLDLARQVDLEERLAELRRESGIAIVAVSHDVNLSTRRADQVVLMRDGAVLGAGPASTALTAEALSAAFGIDLRAIEVQTGGRPWFVPDLEE